MIHTDVVARHCCFSSELYGTASQSQDDHDPHKEFDPHHSSARQFPCQAVGTLIQAVHGTVKLRTSDIG